MVFVSCVKKDDYYKKDSAESNRKQVVQIIGADGLIQFARDVKPTNDTFILIDLRRYPNTEAELNQSLTVKLQLDPTLIDDYNTANGTAFVEMPSNAYTLLSDITNITFAPGEAIKEVWISVDQSKLDLSEQYALGVGITDPGTNAVVNGSLKDAIYQIGVKNKYDGKYTVTGTMVDYSSASLTANYPWSVELRTSGPNSVIVWDVENDYVLHPILSGGAWSYYGSFGMEFTFDPNTDQVVSVTNPYGQPSSNGRSAALDPSGTNLWEAATKNINIKYWMDQPSVITPHRVSFDELYTYKGPR
jgi:hypothetical protein